MTAQCPKNLTVCSRIKSRTCFLTPSQDANEENLLAEGIAPERIKFVGNVMIDSLFAQLENAKRFDCARRFEFNGRGVCRATTLHRPSNVDNKPTFARILDALENYRTSVADNFSGASAHARAA